MQNELLKSMQEKLDKSEARDAEKDLLIRNLQAEVSYLKHRNCLAHQVNIVRF